MKKCYLEDKLNLGKGSPDAWLLECIFGCNYILFAVVLWLYVYKREMQLHGGHLLMIGMCHGQCFIVCWVWCRYLPVQQLTPQSLFSFLPGPFRKECFIKNFMYIYTLYGQEVFFAITTIYLCIKLRSPFYAARRLMRNSIIAGVCVTILLTMVRLSPLFGYDCANCPETHLFLYNLEENGLSKAVHTIVFSGPCVPLLTLVLSFYAYKRISYVEHVLEESTRQYVQAGLTALIVYAFAQIFIAGIFYISYAYLNEFEKRLERAQIVFEGLMRTAACAAWILVIVVYRSCWNIIQVTYTFKAGEEKGFEIGGEGVVLEVNINGQAGKLGVKENYRILKVMGAPYSPDDSPDTLTSLARGTSDYKITFQVGKRNLRDPEKRSLCDPKRCFRCGSEDQKRRDRFGPCMRDYLIDTIREAICTSVDDERDESSRADICKEDYDPKNIKVSKADCTAFALAPRVFHELRKKYKKEKFKQSFERTPIEHFTEGRSDAFLYFSEDKKFIIKTATSEEWTCLKGLLPKYFEHVLKSWNQQDQQLPKTLINRMFGAFELTLLNHRVRIIIIESCFPDPAAIHQRFDLKGSTVNRHSKESQAPLWQRAFDVREAYKGVLKDLDINAPLFIEPTVQRSVREQLTRDIDFLSENRIIDYSILLGVTNKLHRLPQGSDPVEDRGLSHMKAIEVGGPSEYSIGIIDVLQEYNWHKRLEYLTKRYLLCKGNGISVQEPGFYAKRMKENVVMKIIAPNNPDSDPEQPREMGTFPLSSR